MNYPLLAKILNKFGQVIFNDLFLVSTYDRWQRKFFHQLFLLFVPICLEIWEVWCIVLLIFMLLRILDTYIWPHAWTYIAYVLKLWTLLVIVRSTGEILDIYLHLSSNLFSREVINMTTFCSSDYLFNYTNVQLLLSL